MLDVEKLWRDARADAKVCTITGATKNMVLAAITEGARSFEEIRENVTICKNNECAKNNPSGRGCVDSINTLLDIYVPVFDLMTEGGGCSHSKGGSPAEPIKFDRGPACGDCTGCDGCKP